MSQGSRAQRRSAPPRRLPRPDLANSLTRPGPQHPRGVFSGKESGHGGGRQGPDHRGDRHHPDRHGGGGRPGPVRAGLRARPARPECDRDNRQPPGAQREAGGARRGGRPRDLAGRPSCRIGAIRAGRPSARNGGRPVPRRCSCCTWTCGSPRISRPGELRRVVYATGPSVLAARAQAKRRSSIHRSGQGCRGPRQRKMSG